MPLDGGDDVAHLRPAAAGQGGEQGAVADHHEVLRRLGHHEVVLDPDHVGSLVAQDPPADDAHGLDRRGAVEGGGSRRPPVDDEGFVVDVAHAEPADVADLAGWGRAGPPVRPAWSRSSRPNTRPSYWLSRVVRRRAALKTSASRSNRPVSLLVADVARAVGATPGKAVGLDEPGAEGSLGQLGVDAADVGLLDGDLLATSAVIPSAWAWSGPVTRLSLFGSWCERTSLAPNAVHPVQRQAPGRHVFRTTDGPSPGAQMRPRRAA